MKDFEDRILEEEGWDLKGLIFKSLNIWYFFIIATILALIVAFFINRYSTPIYKVQASILVHDEPSNLNPDALIGLQMFQTQKKLQNEIAVLKSYSLTKKAIQKLNFYISYFLENSKYITTEIYTNAPFTVNFSKYDFQPVGLKFHVNFISDSALIISAEGEEVPIYHYNESKIITIIDEINVYDTIKINEHFKNEYGNFVINKNSSFNYEFVANKEFSFIFYTQENLINTYRGIEIDYNKESSVLTLAIKGSNIQKTVDYANTLINVYLEREVDKKNQVAVRTINFIDLQLGEILDSLNSSEKKLQDFKATNQVMNMDLQTQQIFTRMENVQDEKVELMIKLKYYNYLKEYLQVNNDVEDLIAPSSIGITDPSLNKLIIVLATLYNEKSELMANSIKTNPYLNSIESQLKNTKKSLLENIENIIAASEISLSEIEMRIKEISSQIDKLPKTQRELFSFERNFKLNDAIYTYLLQKRSEMQIAKASNIPANEVLDPAMLSSLSPIYPKKRLNYILALIIGMALPIIYILLKDYFNTKIHEIDDIYKITDYPVLGYIIHNTNKEEAVVVEHPLSNIAESFRSIRTNFQFISNNKPSKIILVTSSMKGEGKSFVSLNIATTFATNNKKTVLLVFDLRNPKIYFPLESKSKKGLSNYINGKAKLDEIIQSTSIPNLDIISSGPIPPNPTELISTGKTADLFS